MKQTTKARKKVKEATKKFIKKEYNRNYSKEWYSTKRGKDYMKKFCKKYYEDNKDIMRLTTKEKRLKDSGFKGELKDKVRNNLIDILNRYKIKTILTLESKDFLFSKLLPDKKIIVFERNELEYKSMLKTKPKNVSLFAGDISGFKEIDMNIDVVYLDFCGTFDYEKEVIYDLKEHIKKSKLFAFTFSLRDKSEKFGDYQFDLINKLQTLLELNFKVVYGEAYRDSTPMITIVLENSNE
jgi:hypothetical protein